MCRGVVRLLIGLLLSCGPLVGMAQEPARWAQNVLEFFMLESGMGVRWEPSPAEVRQFASALKKPLTELHLNGAPFAQTGDTLVTPEGLAWTILAELQWAKQLNAQGSPQALLFIYLASHQVSFAKNEMLDPDRGLYYRGWRDGKTLEGDPEPRDQILMFWALSAYSQLGDLLSTGETQKSDAELFRKFVSPLADHLFQAIQKAAQISSNWWHLTSSEEGLWFQALGEYLGITLDSTLQSEAREAWQESRVKIQTQPWPDDSLLKPETARYSLTELADALERLDIQQMLQGSVKPQQFEALLSAPPVQALLQRDPPWPRSVEYDALAKEWRVDDPLFQTASAMSVAFRILRLAGQGASLEEKSLREADLSLFVQTLDRWTAQLEATQITPLASSPSARYSRLPHQPSTWLELLILVAALILSLELIALAWWRHRA